MAGGRAAKFSIVCSDQPRNGKTLVARLIADYQLLCERELAVLDLSPAAGGTRRFFPIRARKIDLTKTADQMVLFDHALLPPLHDSVLDLPSHLLGEFFQLTRNFGFSDAAHAHGVELAIYFVVDKTTGSMTAAERIRQDNAGDRFIIVWNEAFLPALSDGSTPSLLEHLKKSGQLVIPKLPPEVLKAIEDPGFSFSNFVVEDAPRLTGGGNQALKDFLSQIFGQLDRIEEEAVPDARVMSNATQNG